MCFLGATGIRDLKFDHVAKLISGQEELRLERSRSRPVGQSEHRQRNKQRELFHQKHVHIVHRNVCRVREPQLRFSGDYQQSRNQPPPLCSEFHALVGPRPLPNNHLQQPDRHPPRCSEFHALVSPGLRPNDHAEQPDQHPPRCSEFHGFEALESLTNGHPRLQHLPHQLCSGCHAFSAAESRGDDH